MQVFIFYLNESWVYGFINVAYACQKIINFEGIRKNWKLHTTKTRNAFYELLLSIEVFKDFYYSKYSWHKK